jgi:hypothetical protein
MGRTAQAAVSIQDLFRQKAQQQALQQQRQQKLQDALLLSAGQARIKQQFQSPLEQFLQFGKVADTLNKLGIDPRSVFGGQVPGGGQAPDTTQPTIQPGGQPTITPTDRGVVGGGFGQFQGGQPQLEATKFQQTPFGGIRPTEFQPKKGLAAESASKLTLISQAISDLESVEKKLFTKEGRFLRGLAAAANIPGGRLPGIPSVGFGTKAREISSEINNALEAKLRIETGAAATQEEFDRLQDRFGITAFDTAASAKSKLRRLKEFMKNARVTIDPTGRFQYRTGDTPFDNQLNAPTARDLGLDPNRFEIIEEVK